LLVVIEVALGFGFLALVISYVPSSTRHSRDVNRESRCSTHEQVPQQPQRSCFVAITPGRMSRKLLMTLREWELWCADILESHLSYPVLAYYRSQHDQQSWIEALTAILDMCALILAGIDGISAEAARFTFAMARHAAVDLSQVLALHPQRE